MPDTGSFGGVPRGGWHFEAGIELESADCRSGIDFPMSTGYPNVVCPWEFVTCPVYPCSARGDVEKSMFPVQGPWMTSPHVESELAETASVLEEGVKVCNYHNSMS